MAAVAYPINDPWVVARPIRPCRTVGAAVGGRRLDAGVYRRRRVVALLTLAAIALVMALGARTALAGPGRGALTTSGSAGAAAPISGHFYVVQAGDSLWSIVQATGYHGDPRPVVDRLADELHGRQLQPGQRLLLP